MKCNICKKLVAISCLLPILSMSIINTPLYVQASETGEENTAEAEETSITPSSFQKWTQGTELSYEIFPEEEELVRVQINKITEEEDSIGFLFENKKRNISGSDAFSFWIENPSAEVLSMNISITDSSETGYSLPDGSYVIAEDENGENGQILEVLYGKFDVPADFKGNLYIPLELLAPQETSETEEETTVEEKTTFTNIVSWGITVLIKDESVQSGSREEETEKASLFREEQERRTETKGETIYKTVNYSIKNIAFWKNSMETQMDRYYRYQIKGESRIQIPTVEDSVTTYTVEVYDLFGKKQNFPVKLSVKTDTPGIEIGDDGTLTVTPEAKPGSFEIEVSCEEAVNKGTMEIEAYESWRVNYEGEGNDIPTPEEEKPLLSDGMNLLISNVWLVRIIVIAGCIAALSLFLWYWRLSEKLYKTMNQQIAEEQEEN